MHASGGRFLEVETDRYRRAGCTASQNNARTFVSRLDVGRARANLDAYEICSVGPVTRKRRSAPSFKIGDERLD